MQLGSNTCTLDELIRFVSITCHSKKGHNIGKSKEDQLVYGTAPLILKMQFSARHLLTESLPHDPDNMS